MEFGIIRKPAVWLYGENRKNAVDELFMGWAVKVLEEQDGWCKVITHYGYPGYVEKGMICACTAEDLVRRDQSGNTVLVERACVDLMDRPDVHGRILGTVGRGSFFTVLQEERNGYRAVRTAEGERGYLPSIAYSERKECDGYLYAKNPESYFRLRKPCGKDSEVLLRKRLVAYAKAYLGTQYRWAGKSAQGIDCSGLTFMCYLMNGILIYRDAEIKAGYPIHEIPLEQAKPGDLLYFLGHVAMYIGSQKYIHATGNEKSFGCVINSLSAKDSDFRADLADMFLMAGSIL